MERFWAKVDKTGDCWNWTSVGKRYGQFSVGGKLLLAHRVSWSLSNGPIPDGLHVLHRCDNGKCVNPEHLFLGTHFDNMRDKVSKGRHAPSIGSKNGCAKLTERDVSTIRSLVAAGYLGQDCAKLWGVSGAAVSLITLRKKWKHVP